MNGVPNAAAKETAESRKRLVKQAVGKASSASIMSYGYYNVIYELIEELKTQIKDALVPPHPGTFLGRLTGKIAGCEVFEGIVRVDSKVRVLRGKRNVIYTGSISSLKVMKDDVREVPLGRASVVCPLLIIQILRTVYTGMLFNRK